ncbi:MAG: CPBP family intramembrane metalloprotease [Phycisphaerales bacterium]|nr:MAG: CPBP family intramembrane metalloprotease [Phycisphaerales bacterium]
MTDHLSPDEGFTDSYTPPELPAEEIPLARPVVFPESAPTTQTGHEILLLSASRLDVLADLFVVVLFVVGMDVLVRLVLSFLVISPELPLGTDLPEIEQALFPPMLAIRTILVIVAVAAILRHRKQGTDSIGVSRIALRLNAAIGIVAILATALLIFMWQMVMLTVWPGLLEQMGENADRIMALVPRLHPLGFVGVSLAVAVYEEVLFRGFLLTRLRRATGSWTIAVVVSTAVFTLLHSIDQTPAAMAPITILALSFCLTTIWRRSIIPAIVGHFFFDLYQFVVLFFFVEQM